MQFIKTIFISPYFRIQVEPLESVDGIRILGDVVIVEGLDAAEERWSLDHSQEVRIVQPLK
jgi:hypothetical protein